MTTEKMNSKAIKIMSFFHSPQSFFNILHRRKRKGLKRDLEKTLESPLDCKEI